MSSQSTALNTTQRMCRYALLVLFNLGILTACTPLKHDQVDQNQVDHNASIDSICQVAEQELASITSDAEWIIAATELATTRVLNLRPAVAFRLVNEALQRTKKLNDPLQHSVALIHIAPVLIELGELQWVNTLLDDAESMALQIEDENKRWDTVGKIITLRSLQGDIEQALNHARSMPANTDNFAAYKARTLQGIAINQARQQNLDTALATLSSITIGPPYYPATARTELAVIAHNGGKEALAKELLQEVEKVGVALEDGYFGAGILRHVGDAYAAMQDPSLAQSAFALALDAAASGKSNQHHARAMSRIATSMADFGYFTLANDALPKALSVARQENNEQLRFWAAYEIAGSAAFAGDFDLAQRAFDLIPTSTVFVGKSLNAATQRDIAWGLAKHQRLDDAIDMAMGIASPRERVQALSRIARVIGDPTMKALPRYL